MKNFKRRVKYLIEFIQIKLKFYPNIFLYASPFKIYEFTKILKLINKNDQDIFLDIGCGLGLQTFLLGKICAKIIGIDISEKFIGECNKKRELLKSRINSEFYQGKLEEINFKGQLFDKIFSFSVLEHIENYEKVLKITYKLLKKGGHLLFSCDSLETIKNDELLVKHKSDHSVKNYFRSNELKKVLQGIGFSDIKVYPIFQSLYAKNLFTRGIMNNFSFGKVTSIIYYYLMRLFEKNEQNDEGIFLIISCIK